MNIEEIETFILLAENGNFTKTAEIQYVVQSTISNRISELEKYIGKDLFIRNNKNVKLTKAGEVFLPYARRMLMLKKEAIVKARAVGIFEDRLALGAADSIYRGIISPMVKEYFLRFPNMAVKLKINHSEEIIKLLGDGILDVGFVYKNVKSNKLKMIDFYEDEIILIKAFKDKHIKEEICFEELADLPLLYADLGEEFFKWLSELLGDSPLLKLSVDEIHYVIDYVKDGLGCAFVTKSLVRKELAREELVEVKIKGSMPPSKQVYMLINKNKEDTLAIRNWLQVLQDGKGK